VRGGSQTENLYDLKQHTKYSICQYPCKLIMHTFLVAQVDAANKNKCFFYNNISKLLQRYFKISTVWQMRTM